MAFLYLFYVKSPLSLVMFQTIVAEMTTKDKSYDDYFPADLIALFIAFLPSKNPAKKTGFNCLKYKDYREFSTLMPGPIVVAIATLLT